VKQSVYIKAYLYWMVHVPAGLYLHSLPAMRETINGPRSYRRLVRRCLVWAHVENVENKAHGESIVGGKMISQELSANIFGLLTYIGDLLTHLTAVRPEP
jgi:hypothetical protein